MFSRLRTLSYFLGNVDGKTSHCFPLTFNNSQQEVAGVPGILSAYANAINRVGLVRAHSLLSVYFLLSSHIYLLSGVCFLLLPPCSRECH
jgi:hypothetical protein